jgi:hypothetical protein
VEGADQPFCLEIVAAHASIGRWTRSSFMTAEAYNVGSRPEAKSIRDGGLKERDRPRVRVIDAA